MSAEVLEVMPPFTVRLAGWNNDQADLYAVRREVFVVEQEVPEELEVDGYDPECLHVLAVDENENAIGTARLLPDGRIGRVAVLKLWRKNGVGTALMQCLIDEAEKHSQGEGDLRLHAQTWTIPFYESLGFIVEGDEFDEAGIPHRPMVLRRCGNSLAE